MLVDFLILFSSRCLIFRLSSSGRGY